MPNGANEAQNLVMIEKHIFEAEGRVTELMRDIAAGAEAGLDTSREKRYLLREQELLEPLYESRHIILRYWRLKHDPTLMP